MIARYNLYEFRKNLACSGVSAFIRYYVFILSSCLVDTKKCLTNLEMGDKSNFNNIKRFDRI